MKKSQLLAVLVALFAFLWILSGVIGKNDQSDAPKTQAQEKPADTLMSVRVVSSNAQPYQNMVKVTGRTQVSRKVELKAEVIGQIQRIGFEEGEYVERGDVLAVIEPRERSALLEEAQQKVNQAGIEYEAAKILYERGFGSKVSLSSARAALDGALAGHKAAKIDLSKTKIRAPFSGFLSVQHIETGDVVSTGSSVFTLVNADPIEVAAYVSEHAVQGIKKDQVALVRLFNGQEFKGTVTYIAPVADERTRTFRILVTLPNEDGALKEGVTADVYLPAREIKAHKISPAILGLDNDGKIGIKAVDMNGHVEFYPVEVLSDSPDYMWVAGLPEALDIITVGQNFVTAGQKVNAVNEAKK